MFQNGLNKPWTQQTRFGGMDSGASISAHCFGPVIRENALLIGSACYSGLFEWINKIDL